jgi:hypothetical protein
MKITVFALVLFIVCNSCNVNKVDIESIKIDIKETNVKNIFSAHIDSVIPLDSSDSSLVGIITKVRYFNNCYYVFDILHKRTVACFSNQGHMKYSIPLGRGPGEVTLTDDFAISDSSLYIKSLNNINKYYINTGRLQKVFNLPAYFNKFSFIDSIRTITFGYSPSYNDLAKYSSDQEELLNRMKLYKILNIRDSIELRSFLLGQQDFSSFVPNDPISIFNNQILCLYPPYEEIYEYVFDEMKPKYKIDFGPFSFNEKELKKGDLYYTESIKDGKRVGFIDYINETKDFIIFSIVKEIGKYSSCIYSKTSQKSVLFQNILFDIGLPDMTILSTVEDKMICVLDPAELNESQIKEFNKRYNPDDQINETSNSVLLILTIYEK